MNVDFGFGRHGWLQDDEEKSSREGKIDYFGRGVWREGGIQMLGFDSERDQAGSRRDGILDLGIFQPALLNHLIQVVRHERN